MTLTCNYCTFRCSDGTSLVKHVFQAHHTDPLFHWVCAIRGCSHSFTAGSTYSSFLSHANRKHVNWADSLKEGSPDFINSVRVTSNPNSGGANDDDGPNPLTGGTNGGLDHSDGLDRPGGSEPDPDDGSALSNQISLKEAAARFLLTLKEKYRLTQAAVDFSVGSVKQMLSMMSEEFKKSASLETSTSERDLIDPFDGLETEYFQLKYYREKFHLVVSSFYVLNPYKVFFQVLPPPPQKPGNESTFTITLVIVTVHNFIFV